jgi:hypothetical protein
MVPEKNIKSVEGDLKIVVDNKIIISPQRRAEVSATIVNKITAKKDCGKLNRCTGCKLLDL